MDFLQVALIFLILLLSIFLSITGIQVFFILRDLKKALDKLNAVLEVSENIATDIDVDYNSRSARISEKPISAANSLAGKIINRNPKPKRFYKKVL